MAPLAALVCFLVALLGGHLGGVDLVVLGFAFIALSLLIGPYPFGGFVARFHRE